MSRKNVSFKKGLSLLLITALIGSSCYQSVDAKKKKAEINCKSIILKIGKTKKLKIKNNKKKVRWSSKNKKIATVTQKGLVKARKKGKTKIVAKIGKKKYSCKVTVRDNKISARPTPISSKSPVISAPPMVSQSPVVSKPPVVTQSPEPSKEPWPSRAPLEELSDPNWETGKKSGTEEDYNKYFALDIKQYSQKQDATILGSMEDISYYSEVVGADREATVYLPPAYSADKKYPVLYMIHGLGCDKSQWPSMQLNNILSNMICNGEVPPIVAVIPSVVPKDGLSYNTFDQANLDAFYNFEEEFLQDLEPYILSNYSVSADRKDTGVCGLSMGGMEALSLGFSIKDHFNYIGSFSAAPSLNQDLLTLDGWKSNPEVVLLCSGTSDGTVGENPYNYHMSLEKNQVNHIWYQYPKGGHDVNVWKNGLVNFLKRSY